MIVQILEQPIQNVEGDAVILHLVENARPPKGATGTVDWYLNGFISRLIRDGHVRKYRDEMILIATQRRIRVPRLFLLGVGESGRFDPGRLASQWYKASQTICHMKLYQLVTAIPILKDQPVGLVVENFMLGLLEGIKDFHENTRHFRLLIANFDELETKSNKDQAREKIKSFKQVELLGF